MTTMEFPRCAVCRVAIEAGQNVMFRPDGRVSHVDCPDLCCQVCGHLILPQDARRRDGHTIVHSSCWLRQWRASARTASGVAPPPMTSR